MSRDFLQLALGEPVALLPTQLGSPGWIGRLA